MKIAFESREYEATEIIVFRRSYYIYATPDPNTFYVHGSNTGEKPYFHVHDKKELNRWYRSVLPNKFRC